MHPVVAGNLAPTLSDVSYGTHERQKIDFYKASSQGPAPLLFFIHGGGWMNGDKSGDIPLLQQCLDNGISVASINYRLIPDATAKGIKPPVKACLEDAARALQFVRSRASEWNIDPSRIAACGGSAGGFTALWLAFHPDMAAPNSSDPIARQSTRPACVLAFVPQTSLDPKQMREWLPNIDYGHHAFALPSYQDFLNRRDSLMAAIKEYSPYELVSTDDPPVYLFYDSPATNDPLPADPVHSAMFGAGLAEKLKSENVPFEFNHQGATVAHPDIFGFLAENLGAKTPTLASADLESNFPFFDLTAKAASLETGHAAASVVDDAGKPVLAVTFEAGAEFPFVKFPGRWDLSAAPGVKTEITNSGTSPVRVAVRVDNTTHPEDSQEYNSEVALLGPGETSTLEVTFGQSYGSPGFALDPTRVESISILAVSPAEPATLQIRSLAPSTSPKGGKN